MRRRDGNEQQEVPSGKGRMQRPRVLVTGYFLAEAEPGQSGKRARPVCDRVRLGEALEEAFIS